MNSSTKYSNWRYIWILPVLALTLASIPKIFSMKFMVEAMQASGSTISLPLLGITELLFVVVFIIPKTRNIGFLLMTAFIGGIIATEWMSPSENPIVGIMLQVLLWAGMYFERPDFFNTRFKKS